MAAGFEGLSAEEICTYMKEQIPSISDELLERFEKHKIDGSVFFGVGRRIPSRDSATAGRSSKSENNHCQSKPCKLDYIILMYFNRVKVFQLSYKCIRDQCPWLG